MSIEKKSLISNLTATRKAIIATTPASPVAFSSPVSASKVSAAKVSAAKVSAAKVSAAKVSAAKVSAAKLI